LSEAPEGTIHIYNKFWERTRYWVQVVENILENSTAV